ncbi:MAG: hypothetical protein HY897_06385 [Deltaproteobacteria bacterium]|nr:hypothetical protein [Deltaproteobacteria bacterium]
MRPAPAPFVVCAAATAVAVFVVAGSCDSEEPRDAGTAPPLCDISKIMKSCLANLNGCFVPSGKCTAQSLGEYRWESGARLDITATETDIVSTFTGASGDLCYDLTVPISGGDATIRSADGTEFLVRTEVDVPGIGSVTIVCPDGSEETYTETDYEELRACFEGLDSMGGTDAGGSISCTCEDGTYACMFGASAACATDADCSADGGSLLCCMYMGYRYCAAECGPQ